MPSSKDDKDFDSASRSEKTGLFHDLVDFFKNSKSYWLIPIIVLLLVFGAIVVIGVASGAPFIYTLF
jgi:hypothetical protein